MSESIDHEICAFAERILAVREEISGLNGDIKNLYAEAKSNGIDKNGLKMLVAYIEKLTGNAAVVICKDGVFEAYFAAWVRVKGDPFSALAPQTGTQIATRAGAGAPAQAHAKRDGRSPASGSEDNEQQTAAEQTPHPNPPPQGGRGKHGIDDELELPDFLRRGA